MSQQHHDDLNAIGDIKQLGLFSAVASLGYVFWIVGGMEMVERLAYYGVKSVATLYAKDPLSKGGLGVTMTDFGTILMVWAMCQSVIPVFTGGLSDRYGYKETIFASTVVKIMGYLVMAFFPTFNGFFAGAILLATGTAIFKPGIQGTLVNCTTRNNSSMAWGIFYQTVNIGGWIGPVVAGQMRKLAWRNVFLVNAAVISINFIMLLLYKEPGKEQRLARARDRKAGTLASKSLATESLQELRKPHVWTYLGIFSGFWFMFNALFDVLPAHIEDWIDTRGVVTQLFGTEGGTSILHKLIVTNAAGTEIQPEGILNINAGLIMFTCFMFAALSARMKAIHSMIFGTLLACVSLVATGYTDAAWYSIGALVIFSIGEMMSSPKFGEYIGNFAPPDKKAMYLGFSQIPLAIGWTLEGKVGPWLYDVFASKEHYARKILTARGLGQSAVAAIPQGEAFDRLVKLTGRQKWDVTAEIYAANRHRIGTVWYLMACVGLLSAAGMYLYGKWIEQLRKSRVPASH